MADYPEWVLAHKRKGTYINFQNGKYYLYAAHSERIPGTDKVRRVSDGYLGRITEKDGFIPTRKKLTGDVLVYEYGLSAVVIPECERIRKRMSRDFREAVGFVVVSGALSCMYGRATQEGYESSWISIRFPGLDMTKNPTKRQQAGSLRVAQMIAGILAKRFGDEYDDAILLLPLVHMVKMGSETHLAKIPAGTRAFIEKHGLVFREEI
ncbi:hypothetical protein AGMMS49983_21840 [Clostridia bacterium]|nr:hypothetical protein AGMMS49983_21840 [Clostridia bacterium]